MTKLRKRFANKYRLRHGVLLAVLFSGNEVFSASSLPESAISVHIYIYICCVCVCMCARARQILSMARKIGVVFNPANQNSSGSASEVGRNVRKAIAAGYFLNVARAISGPGAGERSGNSNRLSTTPYFPSSFLTTSHPTLGLSFFPGETVYETVRGRQKAIIDKSSVLFMREPAPPLVVYSECNFQAAQEMGYLKTVTPIEQDWL